jgi:hypothetical protein
MASIRKTKKWIRGLSDFGLAAELHGGCSELLDLRNDVQISIVRHRAATVEIELALFQAEILRRPEHPCNPALRLYIAEKLVCITSFVPPRQEVFSNEEVSG